MEELKHSRNALETERLTVKQRVDEMDAKLGEKANAMLLVDENIQKKADKIDEKKVNISSSPTILCFNFFNFFLIFFFSWKFIKRTI